MRSCLLRGWSEPECIESENGQTGAPGAHCSERTKLGHSGASGHADVFAGLQVLLECRA